MGKSQKTRDHANGGEHHCGQKRDVIIPRPPPKSAVVAKGLPIVQFRESQWTDNRLPTDVLANGNTTLHFYEIPTYQDLDTPKSLAR
jgi:hypothetical protein